jgi:acyl-coenzyme A thioesterase PaaI-like protein
MPLDPTTEGWTQAESSGLPAFLHPVWTRREGEHTAYAFGARADLCNARGVIHGGILASFMDQTLGLTARDATGTGQIATIQLDLHYVAAALPDTLVEGRGEVVRKTSSIVFLRGTLTSGGSLLLSATGIWKVLGRR